MAFKTAASFGQRHAESTNDPFAFRDEPKSSSFGDMENSMQQEVERMINEFGNAGPHHLNMRQTAAGVEITAQFPGLDAKDLDVVLEGATLTIRGVRRQALQQESGWGSRYSAPSTESFMQRLNLPFEAQPSQISCRLNDGALKIMISKTGANPAVSARIPVIGG